MSDLTSPGTRVKAQRSARGWSQAELARRAEISRAAVSAIEIDRLVPSVAAALRLAACLGCAVEQLFGSKQQPAAPAWAWEPSVEESRYWEAELAGRVLRFPAEETLSGVIAHDGLGSPDGFASTQPDASRTLIVACCDPAAALLSAEYARQTGLRMIVLGRSSGAALALLKAGRVHVAGVHLSIAGRSSGNTRIVESEIGEPVGVLRLAQWEEGVALGSGQAARSIGAITRGRVEWIGRETGSGARQCLDELLGRKSAPRHLARNHRGVAEALRSGWGDAGVCIRLASEEAGLRFLPVRFENYDLTFLKSMSGDPRIEALVRVVRSAAYRRLLGELPGYDSRDTGQLEWTKSSDRRSSTK